MCLTTTDYTTSHAIKPKQILSFSLPNEKGKSDANKYDFETVLCFSYHNFFSLLLPNEKKHTQFSSVDSRFIFFSSHSVRITHHTVTEVSMGEMHWKKGKIRTINMYFGFYCRFVTLVPCDKIKSRRFLHTQNVLYRTHIGDAKPCVQMGLDLKFQLNLNEVRTRTNKSNR